MKRQTPFYVRAIIHLIGLTLLTCVMILASQTIALIADNGSYWISRFLYR